MTTMKTVVWSFDILLILFVFLSYHIYIYISLSSHNLTHSPGRVILGTIERSAAWTLPQRYIWKQSSLICTRQRQVKDCEMTDQNSADTCTWRQNGK